ncbi:MAG: ABC transporter substrate-binding protein [Rubellimicrobium sp.]|nr:ABC transporter substrate-binding protein [Rubellimicrobium sp.]
MGTALPVAAQTGLCGGVGDNGQWIGGSEANSDVSTAPAAMEQMALVLMRNEYVALFNVSSGTEVRMEAQQRGSGDPVIDLRNAAGEIILSDDDSGGELASRAEAFLEPGTYCLSMSSYDGSPMTGFVRVGRLEHEPLTPGMASFDPDDGLSFDPSDPWQTETICSTDTITQFIGSGPIDAQLASGAISATATVNDVPIWGFTLGQPTAMSITAVNPAADPYIIIYDEFDNYIAENDDFDGLNSRIDFTAPLAAGTYCIEMIALSNPDEPITVSLMPFSAETATLNMVDSGEMSPPLDGSHPIVEVGPIQGRIRQDIQSTAVATWFSIEMPEAGLLIIEAANNGLGDPMVYLYDDFGRQVGFNDDANGTLDSMLAARLLPGTYVVGVREFSQNAAPVPTRVLFERFVTAQ